MPDTRSSPRTPLRIAALVAFVILCGAASCGPVPTDIGYAYGYGYVVLVEDRSVRGDERLMYYVFPTQERAQEFFDAHFSDPDWPDILLPGERKVDYGDTEFVSIYALLRRKVPPLNDMLAPLSVPSLPQPIPQGPQ